MAAVHFKRAATTVGGAVAGRIVRSRTDPVVVLCYHSIHPSVPFASATPEQFAEHLDWLTTACDVIPFGEVMTATTVRADRPRVAITFDDGYLDNHTYALPLLAERGCPATFFLTVGLIERDPEVLTRVGMLRKAPPADLEILTWSHVEELQAAGLELGAHTWSHPNLATLAEDAARVELTRAKEVLEERLGGPVASFAYPFGKPGRHFTPRTELLVRDAGYATAGAILFRAARESDNPLAVPRFFVTRDTLATLSAKVEGRWDWVGLFQERIPTPLARIVSPADFRV